MGHAPHVKEWEIFHVSDDGKLLTYHHTCLGLDGDRVVVSPECEHFDMQNDGGQFTVRTSQGTYVYVHDDGFLRHSPTKTAIDITVRLAKTVTFALHNVEYLNADGRVGKSEHLNDRSRFEIHPHTGYVELKSTRGFLQLKDGHIITSTEPSRFVIVPL
jgi:hypothetical protein